jgi:hypothetical protein
VDGAVGGSGAAATERVSHDTIREGGREEFGQREKGEKWDGGGGDTNRVGKKRRGREIRMEMDEDRRKNSRMKGLGEGEECSPSAHIHRPIWTDCVLRGSGGRG